LADETDEDIGTEALSGDEALVDGHGGVVVGCVGFFYSVDVGLACKCCAWCKSSCATSIADMGRNTIQDLAILRGRMICFKDAIVNCRLFYTHSVAKHVYS
jgi:hypothetical protein